MDGDYSEDEWGFDEDFAELVEPFFAFLYESWWRVKVEGAERVPAHGRVLLTSNHAGILPWDATMISMALLREHPLPRHPRFLVLDWAFDLPWISAGIRKVGGVVASPFNALRLLEKDQLVAVFPEGVKGMGKRSGSATVSSASAEAASSSWRSAPAPHRPGRGRGREEMYPRSSTLRRWRLWAPLLPGHTHVSVARSAGSCPADEVAHPLCRADRDRVLRA